MIEFTKEELKTIYLNMSINHESYEIVDKIAKVLKQSEGECDHEFIPVYKNPYLGLSYFKCAKCDYCHQPE